MKDKFIKELERQLNRRNYNATSSVVDYYDEVISDRLEDGEDLKTILEELGDPENIAIELTNDAPALDESTHNHQEFHDVSDLSIDVVNYDINITKSLDDRLIIDYDCDDKNYLSVEFDGDELSISEGSKSTSFFSFFKMEIVSEDNGVDHILNIMVPSHLEDVEVEDVSGDIRIDYLSCEDLKIENTSGDLELETIKCEECQIETVSGDTRIKNLKCDEFEFEAVSGDINCQDILLEEGDIETVSGDISIMFNGNRSDYSISLSKPFSSIQSDNDGDREVDINTVSGEINYTFTNSR